MNNELIKTIDGLEKNKEKNLKIIEKCKKEIAFLTKENKQINSSIKKLKILEGKYIVLIRKLKILLIPKRIFQMMNRLMIKCCINFKTFIDF